MATNIVSCVRESSEMKDTNSRHTGAIDTCEITTLIDTNEECDGASVVESGTTGALKDFQKLTCLLAGASPVTWVFAGDSITHGALYTEGWRCFSEQFTERVRWELRRLYDVVINTGVVGETSTGMLANLQSRVLRFCPEVVLVLIGVNDALAGPDGQSLFRDNLHEIVRQIRQVGGFAILQTPNAVYPQHSRFLRNLPAYVAVIRDVAHESQTMLVDHFRHWQQAKPEPDQLLGWLQDQSMHPNVYGHREMARLIYRRLGIFDPKSLSCRLDVL